MGQSSQDREFYAHDCCAFGGTVLSERAQSYFCGFLTSLSLGIEAPRLPVTYLMAQLPIA